MAAGFGRGDAGHSVYIGSIFTVYINMYLQKKKKKKEMFKNKNRTSRAREGEVEKGKRKREFCRQTRLQELL